MPDVDLCWIRHARSPECNHGIRNWWSHDAAFDHVGHHHNVASWRFAHCLSISSAQGIRFQEPNWQLQESVVASKDALEPFDMTFYLVAVMARLLEPWSRSAPSLISIACWNNIRSASLRPKNPTPGMVGSSATIEFVVVGLLRCESTKLGW